MPLKFLNGFFTVVLVCLKKEIREGKKKEKESDWCGSNPSINYAFCKIL